jgi:hypothetical protein
MSGKSAGNLPKCVDAPLAAVVGIADQTLAFGIDHRIEGFQRDPADQDGVLLTTDSPDITDKRIQF